MSTPHNQANKGDIAKTVLMPGDPLRAKYLAETYLENVKQFNATRSMFGYTGTYKGKEVSIMGSGIGMPSIGIYSYELFHFYDVENIIRIGSCGSFKEDVHLRDIIIVQGACTDSNYAHQYELPGTYSAISDYSLLEKAVEKFNIDINTKFEDTVWGEILINNYLEYIDETKLNLQNLVELLDTNFELEKYSKVLKNDIENLEQIKKWDWKTISLQYKEFFDENLKDGEIKNA